MSSKKKKPASSWVQCNSCGIITADRDVSSHAKDCPPNPSTTPYPYVNKNHLYCSLDIHSSKGMPVL